MRYTHVAAWSFLGGVSLPTDQTAMELFASDSARFILSREPDDYLTLVDCGSVISLLMLRGLVGQAQSSEFEDALNEELTKLRAERKKKMGANAVLIFVGNGEIEASMTGPIAERKDFVVTFDAVNRESIRRHHRPDILAMKLAIGLEGDSMPRYDKLADGSYLIDEQGRAIYSYSFSAGSAEAFVSTSLNGDALARISDRYTALLRDENMDSVQRLFSEMSDRSNDRLKAFLSGWAALEILVSKTFKTYEDAFLSPFLASAQPSLRERFLDRLQTVMNDKYRLVDKYLVVSTMLFADASPESVEEDFTLFKKLKDVRDSIYHGGAFVEQDLPVAVLGNLLKKFLSAHAVAFDKHVAKA